MHIDLDSGQEAIDLSMPITDHWRFSPTISYGRSDAPGCAFHSTSLAMGAHSFTHVDAPLHVQDEGPALQPGDVNSLWGVAKVIDVTGVGADRAISADALQAAAPQIDAGEIVLIRSSHETRFPTTVKEYWTRSPWMTADAAGWLRDRRVGAVGFDFPQDRGIRNSYVDDWVPGDPLDDWACHKILLTDGIFQIEYLQNLGAIQGESCLFFAVPLNFARADGSPVRAFALPYTSRSAVSPSTPSRSAASKIEEE